LAFSLVALTFASCIGAVGNGYPEVQTTSALGKPGQCQNCGKQIASVAESELLTVGSARYVVCSEKCQEETRQWHISQFGGGK
jgi:hypothetical protein